MSREDFCSVLRVFCIFAGKYERISEKIDVFSWTSSMYKVVFMLEEESTPERGPSMVFVLVAGATQG